jgi:membrane protein DedA with SNARE-associated domain
MNLFADYVQPLTNWLQANPHWSLFITFFIALTESLAIIGSIVPGSVTMTAIGILAGSGIMRIDLTLVAATLGAVCGDSLSYALGYYYRDHLVEMWPFKKYPNLLTYGKEFFSRHGGKSVLIGRFVGPLRSIIPVIAGIMNMKQWRFLIANVISAIGWSILYVMPGVFIGAAGHELSTESATRLFILILIALAAIWLASFLLKLIFITFNSFLKKHLHNVWLSARKSSVSGKLYNAVTPDGEINHYPTAGLVLLLFINLIVFLMLLLISTKTSWLNTVNYSVHFFAQSFHTTLMEAFFILCSQFTSNFTLISLYIASCLWFIYHKNKKIVFYLTSLLTFGSIISFLIAHGVQSPRPPGLLVTMPGYSFPDQQIVMGTAFYVFILFYINTKYSLLTNTFRSIIWTILGLSGFASVYLGDYWLTDVVSSYFIGIIICLSHWLIYRKSSYTLSAQKNPSLVLLLFIGAVLFFTMISTYLNFKTLAHNHSPYHKQFSLTQSSWWNQQEPVLPLYSLNRIGNRLSLLNIQFYGDLESLESALEQNGWQHRNESFFTKLMMRFNSSNEGIKLPLLAQLYENKRPELVMTYRDKQSKLILELIIWESNYSLTDRNRPIWIGTLHQNIRDKTDQMKNVGSMANFINTLSFVMPSLNEFTLRRVEIPENMINTVMFPTAPYILLIKQKHDRLDL